MFIQPWDAALDPTEWQERLGTTDRFGCSRSDHNPTAHRERVIDRPQERDHGLDTGAAAQQRRRWAAIGDWNEHRASPADRTQT